MPSKPALIRQSDVTRIVKGAAAAGVALGIVVINGEVRFLPLDQMKPPEQPSAIDEFRARRSADKARGRTPG